MPTSPTSPTSPGSSRRRRAALTGAALLAATALPAGTAHGLPAASALPRAVAHVAAAHAAVAATTAGGAVGKLAPSGCTVTAGAAACDLFAAPGTTLVGGRSLPIWGFSGAAGAAPSSPGPQLVVTQGDQVTVTLHNAWDPASTNPQTLGLAFPGLGIDTFAASAGPDQAPAGPGGTVSYTFTADHAGTFLYEAGHTPVTGNGARQEAMGLVGALVVLPTDEATTTAYDDDTVLVLSEIDPALAAHPDTFDMRDYSPRYRLVNGNSFPEIPAVATDPGHTVRLRYVDAGQRQHPMTILGTTQRTIARDGHDLRYPEGQVTAVLEPGTTADTLVPVPDDGTTAFTLYESGQHLDTAGQVAGETSTQLAFGGMMTTLDTQAPTAGADSAGPKASAVTLSAPTKPPTGQDPVTLTATLDDSRSGGSPVVDAEYVVDDATSVAVGLGTHLDVADPTAASTTATATLSPDQLSTLSGTHTVYVRGKDAAGNWGAFGSVVLTVAGYGAATTAGYLSPALTNLQGTITLNATGDATATAGPVTAAEYYLTDDPSGPSADRLAAGGTPMALNRTASVVAEKAVVGPQLAGLSSGRHSAWVRSKDGRGLWGPLTEVDFVVDTDGPTANGLLSPNPTNGLVSAPGTPGYATVSATVDDTGHGGSPIVDAEAFVNPADITTVVDGNGLQLVPDQPVLTGVTAAFHGSVPLSQLRSMKEGSYTVYVHGKDAAGNWGPFQSSTFQVIKTAPVLGTATAGLAVPAATAGAATITATVPQANPGNAVSSTWLGAAEIWWGTTDPGVGRGTPVTATLVDGDLTLTALPVTKVAPGVRQLNVRVSDLAGNWSNVVSATTTVSPPVWVQESFSAPLVSPWGLTGTAVSVNGGALRVTSGTAKAFVTSAASASRPLGTTLSSATVAVDLDASGVTRAGWTTVVSGTGQGASVLALQLQRTATGAVQVRTVMARPGTTPVNGPAVTLPGAKATAVLGWRAGPRLGTASTPGGQLTLSLGGTVVSTTTGNTGGLAVTGISIGVVGTPVTPGLRQTLLLDNLRVTG